MAANIDELQIEINANATKANQAIDRLVTKLNGLSASLSKLNTSSLTGLANGVNRLGSAMQTMNTVKTTDFTRLANNIQRLGSINVQSLNSAASSMSHLTRAFNNLGTVSANAMQVGELAKNISKLGNASVQRAITNIPQLATSLNQLMTTLSRAPRVSSSVIQMTQALANLASQGSRVGNASRSMVSGLANTRTAMTRTTKSTFSLAAAFGRFYANYFLVIRGIKRFVSAITGTSDYIEAFNYYTVAMGKIASKWDKDWETYGDELGKTFSNKFIETTNETFSKLSGIKLDLSADFKSGILSETGMKNLGLNIKEVTQYAAQLASMLDSVGQSGETTLATTNAMVKLAGDISSLYNIDYSDAAKNIQSVLMGQSRAGYKFGWDTTMASLQAVADKFSLSKPVSEMTQMEKQQLRVLTILEQSKVSWGDLANTIDSPSNMIRQFKNNLSEAGMVLGQLFIPLLQKVLPVLNGVLKAFTRLFESIAGFFNIKLDFSKYGQGYSEVEEGVDGLTDSLDGMAESAEKAKAGLRGFDELKTISSPKSSSGSDVAGGGSIDLSDEISKATEEYNKIWEEAYNKMEDRVGKFADKVEKSLEPIKKLFKDLSIGDYFAVGEDVSTIVSGINNFFARAIERVNWQKIGKNIGDFMAGINWTQILSSFGRLFWAGVNGAIDMWKGSFKSAPIETTILSAIIGISMLGSAFAGISSILGKLMVFFSPLTSIISSIGAAFSSLGGIISGLSTPFLIVRGVFIGLVGGLVAGLALVFAKNEEVRQSFYDSVDAIMGNLEPALNLITNDVLPDLRSGWDKLLKILKPFGDFLNDVFVSIWQDMINPALKYIGETVLPIVINTFSNLWNKILVPFGEFLGNILAPVIKLISGVLSSLWKNVMVPLGQFIGSVFAVVFEGIASIFNDVLIPVINAVINVFNFLWTNVLSPIATWLVDSLVPIFDTAFSFIGGLIDGLKGIFTGLITFITGIFTLDLEKALKGVVGMFDGICNVIITVIESVVNFVIDGLNTFFGGFDGIVSSFGKVIGIDIEIPKINKIEIPRYATGGFPEDGLFMANRGELVGEFSNGRTAVANNDQITKGIADAVYPAVYNAVVSAMSNSSSNQNVNVTLQGDVNKIFRAVQDESRSYTRRTGKPAFN